MTASSLLESQVRGESAHPIRSFEWGTGVMNTLDRRSIASLVLMACAAFVSAEASEVTPGIYKRDSLTCGGPGSADGPVSCTLVTEDEMQVVSPAPSSGARYVSFFVHYGYGEYCRFEGQGVRSKAGRLLLSDEAASKVKNCQLALVPGKGSITISDTRSKCVPTLCSTESGRLNGLIFRIKE